MIDLTNDICRARNISREEAISSRETMSYGIRRRRKRREDSACRAQMVVKKCGIIACILLLEEISTWLEINRALSVPYKEKCNEDERRPHGRVTGQHVGARCAGRQK